MLTELWKRVQKYYGYRKRVTTTSANTNSKLTVDSQRLNLHIFYGQSMEKCPFVVGIPKHEEPDKAT